MAFVAKKRPCLAGENQVPRLTFVVPAGSISLLYQHLADAQLAADETAINLVFGTSHRAIVRGNKLGAIYNEICSHYALRVQACRSEEDQKLVVDSVEVNPIKKEDKPA